jgi:hypothetical protein
MQNKPNLLDAQMNASVYYTKIYNNETAFRRRKNKPNSNPIKPNFQKAKMNVNLTLTKDYRKKDDFVVRINKPNFFKGQNERKIGCIHISKKYNVLIRKVLDSQTNFVVKNGLY